MKYYRIHIDSKASAEIYNEITKILGVKPTQFESENSEDLYSLWTYAIDENEEDETPYYDFVNNFLNIIEPKLSELKKIGIKKRA